MPLYNSPALTLKRTRFGEADLIVTLFTSRYGKIKAVVKGALKTKSRFGGRLEPFILANAIWFGKETTDLYSLNGLDITEPFLNLRNDFDKINRAFASVEFVDAIEVGKEANSTGFSTLLDFWVGLTKENNKTRLDLLLRLFELKYLALAGYRPILDRCVSCGGVTGRKSGFDAVKGGAICGSCYRYGNGTGKISQGALKLLEKSLNLPSDRLHRLGVSQPLMAEINMMVKELVGVHVRRKMRAEKFLAL